MKIYTGRDIVGRYDENWEPTKLGLKEQTEIDKFVELKELKEFMIETIKEIIAQYGFDDAESNAINYGLLKLKKEGEQRKNVVRD